MSVLLYSEVNVLCIVLLSMMMVRMRRNLKSDGTWGLLTKFLVSAIVFFTLDLIWGLVNSHYVWATSSINYLLNASYFIMSGVMAYIWFLFSQRRQGSKLVTSRQGMLVCAIPLILLVVMTCTTWLTRWFFYIDETGAYQRGSLHYVQVILAYGYIVYTSVSALVKSCRMENYVNKAELRTLARFVVFPIICGVIQLLAAGVPVLCVGITLAMLQMLMNFQEQLISIDGLTQINNRGRMVKLLSDKMQSQSKNGSLYVFIMDIDNFKEINDQCGHVQGDRALVQVAEALKRICAGRSCFIARYGGDEFVLIGELDSRSDAERLRDEIKCAVIQQNLSSGSEYALTVSVGFAAYDKSIRYIPEFIALADKDLYADKCNKKTLPA